MALTELNVKDMRKVYMITFSHVNFEKCPNRKNLSLKGSKASKFLLKAFDSEKSLANAVDSVQGGS